MATTRTILSGSTSGKPIKVVQTATAGTLIHTAATGAMDLDLIYLYVANTSGTAATLTLEWGGVTDPGDHLCKGYSVAANSGPTLVASGIPLNGGLIVRAFSGTTNVLNISGYVLRVGR